MLTLPALALAEGPEAPNADAAYAVPLHRLTEADAYRLHGKRGLWYVRAQWATGQVECGCESPDDVERRCRLRPGQAPAVKMVVEATLRVHRRPPRGAGQASPAVLEFSLQDAVRRFAVDPASPPDS